jgi:hypothetical protein
MAKAKNAGPTNKANSPAFFAFLLFMKGTDLDAFTLV